jgi:O-antigen/teichoic acid export membrane protein
LSALTVRGALLWSVAERYAGLVVNLISTMLLARLLTPGQVGVFSLCAAVLLVAGILRDFGVSEYLIQEKELSREKLRAAFTIAIVVAWSIGLCTFLVRHQVAAFYNEPGVADVLTVLCLNFLILPLGSPAFALLNREMAFRKIFLIHLCSVLMQAVTGVLLAQRGHGFMSLAWSSVAGIATQTVVISVLRPHDSFMMPGLRGARVVLHYGIVFSASRLLESFTRNAHEFIIAKQTGFAAVGLFSRAMGLIELFNTTITSAVMRVANPAFASDYRAGRPLAAVFARATAIFTSIAFPFLGFIALMAPEIIRVLFGPQWDAAAPLARILAIGLLPFFLAGFGPYLLLATGNIKRRLTISLWFCPVHLAGVVVASFISLQAVALVWAVSNSVMFLMYTRHLNIVLNSTTWTLFRASLSSVLVSVLCLGVQLLTLFLCRALATNALVTLIATGATTALTWLVAVRLCRHPVYEELRLLVAQRKARA